MSGREGDAKFANTKPILAFDAVQYCLAVGDRSEPVVYTTIIQGRRQMVGIKRPRGTAMRAQLRGH